MRATYYDRNGQPIYDTLEWARMFEDIDSRRVALDEVVCGDEQVRVSTVFIGLNHNWGPGPPLIFETMVFGGPPAVDEWQDRYATEEQAREGHRRVVEALRAADLRFFQDDEP